MAWTSAHFATGMICGGGIAMAACLISRRGWRWTPWAMTAGGVWAIAPDLPRLWREDFPSLPFAAVFGSRDLEQWLHEYGNVFFFHHALDAQPHEYALHGLLAIIVLYNAALAMTFLRRGKAKKQLPRS